MRQNEFLTPEEEYQANGLGWTLERVFQLDTLNWRIMVIPAGGHQLDAESTAREVIYQAKQGVAVALKALRLIKADRKK